MYTLRYGDEWLHDPIDHNYIVSEVKMSGCANASPSLDFTIARTHPIRKKLKLRDIDNPVMVYQNDKIQFKGYIVSFEENIDTSTKVSCIGELSFLNDIKLRPYQTINGLSDSGVSHVLAPHTLSSLFEWYVNQYNSRCGASKRFVIGKNQGDTIVNGATVAEYSDEPVSVGSEISNKILSVYGGYIYVDYPDGIRTINYMAETVDVNEQMVDFGVNLLDYNDTVTSEGMYTAIRATTSEGKTLSSLANGVYSKDKNYYKDGDVVYNIEAVKQYGMIEDSWKSDYITDTTTLLDAAVRRLRVLSEPQITLEIKAIDLALLYDDYQSLSVGQFLRTRSHPHNLDRYLVITDMDVDISNPENTSYTLGVPYNTYTGQQSSLALYLNSTIFSQADRMTSMNFAIKNKSRVFVGGAAPIDGMQENDIWIDTANDNTRNYYSATNVWTPSLIGTDAIHDGAITSLKIKDANITTAKIAEASITEAKIKDAEITTAKIHDAAITSAKIGNAEVKSANIDTAAIQTAHIDDAAITNAKIDDAAITTAKIDDAAITNAKIDDLAVDNAKIQNATIQFAKMAEAFVGDLVVNNAFVNNLEAVSADIFDAKITDATITTAQVSDLSANYAQINLANVEAGVIDTSLIKDAAITDAKIADISANKLTAGTIDASKITVTNLNADNLTVGTINGKLIGSGTVDLDSLAEEVPTKEYLDDLAENLQGQIDGAIETWTSDTIPTLNNYPASSWTDDKTRKTHVGDVLYVINNSPDFTADGYCYRFAESQNGIYEWILIKDSDVTKALQELVEVQGDVSGLKTFETTTSSWITSTDSELSSIKQQHTTLETNLGTKVDTTTFNEVKQSVEENSSAITTLGETLESKADGSAVNELSNTVNSVKQTAESNQASISTLTTTVESKADGSVVETLQGTVNRVEQTAESNKTNITNLTKTVGDNKTTIENRAAAIEQDLSGFKSTVSNTYAEKSDLNDYSTTTEMNSAITQKANEITQTISTTYATKTSVDNIKIGGRNLLMYTDYQTLDGVTNRGTYHDVSIDTTAWDGRNSLKIICKNVSQSGSQDVWQKLWSNVKVGEPLIVSFWVKGSIATKMWIRLAGASAQNTISSVTQSGALSITTSWTKVSYNFGAVTGAGTIGACELIYGFGSTGTFHISNMMLEYGNKPSDWTPAPEDVDQNLNDFKTEVSTTYSTKTELSTTEGKITALAGNIYTKQEIDNKGYTTMEAVRQQGYLTVNSDAIKAVVEESSTASQMVKNYTNGSSTNKATGNPLHIEDSYAAPVIDMMIHGKAYPWNQLVTNGSFNGTSGWVTSNSTMSASNDEISVKASQRWGNINSAVSIVSGHKYLFSFTSKVTTSGDLRAGLGDPAYFGNEFTQLGFGNDSPGQWVHHEYIATYTRHASSKVACVIFTDYRTEGFDSYYIKDVNVFDLTRIYGAGNEPDNYRTFRADFPDVYYPYDAGSVKTVGGKNLLAPVGSTVLNDINFDVNQDGTIHVHGTASANTAIPLIDSNWGANNVNPFDGMGTLTLSGCPAGGSQSTYGVLVYMYKTKGAAVEAKWDTGNGVTFNADGYYAVHLYGAWVAKGQTVDFVAKPQVERGTVATHYVPYGMLEVTSKGKNLFNKDAWSYDGARLSTVGGPYSEDDIGKNSFVSHAIYSKPGKQYSVNFDISATARIVFYSTGNLEASRFVSKVDSGRTFTVPSGAVCFRFCAPKAIKDSVIVYEGSGDDSYEPYTETRTTSPIGDGLKSVDLGSLTWTYYTGAGNPIFYADIADGKRYNNNTELPANIKSDMYKVISDRYVPASDVANAPNMSIALNLNGDINGSRVLIRNTSYTTAEAFKSAMSGVLLRYEPAVKNPDCLASLANGVKDELSIDSEGHKILTKRVGVVDLGTLYGWGKDNTEGIFAVTVPGMLSPETTEERKTGFLCSHYSIAVNAVINEAMSDMSLFRYKAASGCKVYVRDLAKASMDTTAFRTAMSGVMLYYELATPETIDLGTIESPRTMAHVTNMSLSSDIETDFDITYVKDNANGAQLAASILDSQKVSSKAVLDITKDQIQSIVVSDKNGVTSGTKMTQTSTGWIWEVDTSNLKGASGSNYKIFTTNYSYSQADLNTYSASTYSGTWAVIESTSGTKIGDSVQLKVKNGTKNADAFIVGTVTAVPGDKSLTVKSSGLIDSGAKGDNYTLTASDKTTIANEAAGNIVIGGRNLIAGTKDMSGLIVTSNTAGTLNGFTTATGTYPSSSYVDHVSKNSFFIPEGDTYYTLSFWAKGSVDGLKIRSYFYPTCVASGTSSTGALVNGSSVGADGDCNQTITTEWRRYWVTWKTIPTVSGSKSLIVDRLTYNATSSAPGKTVSIYGVKFEKGNKATDWSPAPEDVDAQIDNISIGGRNLLLKSNVKSYSDSSDGTLIKTNYTNSGTVTYTRAAVANLGFHVTTYSLMKPNTEYIVSFEAKQTSGSITSFYMFGTNPNNTLTSTATMDGVVIGTAGNARDVSIPINMSDGNWHKFTWSFTTTSSITGGTYIGHILQFNKSVSTAFGVELRGLKWELGNKATDWSPAPEDINAVIDNIQNGYTILWNYSDFTTSNPGEGYICAYDQSTGTKSNDNGWVMWNGTKRTITKGMINPNTAHPYNIPIYVVCRLSSATSTTGTNYCIWYNSGWKYFSGGINASNGTTIAAWTWNEATDIVLGKYVEPSSEGPFVECEIYNPVRSSKQLTTSTTTASGAQSNAASAVTTANAAKTTAEGIQVGGRNLYVNTSNYTETNPYKYSWSSGDSVFTDFPNGRIHCPYPFEANDVVTVTAESDVQWVNSHGASSTTDGKLGMWVYLCDTPGSATYKIARFLTNDLGVSTKFKATFTIPTVSEVTDIYITMRLNGYSSPSGTQHEALLWNVKLERGNKPTDWTPAPEDVASSINQVQDSLGNVATTADLEARDAVISGIQTNLAGVDGKIASANNTLKADIEQTTSKLKTDLSVLTGDYTKTSEKLDKYLSFDDNWLTIGAKNAKAKVRIDNEQISFIDGNQTIAYINGQILYIANEQVLDNLRLGNFSFFERKGTSYRESENNALTNPSFRANADSWSNWGSPTTREIVAGVGGLKYAHIKTSGVSFQGYSQQKTYSLEYGSTYTASFTAYSPTNNTQMCIGIHWRNASGIHSQEWKTTNVSTEPKRYSLTFTMPSSESSGITGFNFMIGDNTTTVKEFYFCEVKFEKGSVPTDFYAHNMGLKWVNN